MAIAPVLIVDSQRVWGWVGAGALAVAVTVQSAVIWDVALTGNRLASAFIEAIPSVGTEKRIGTLSIDMPPVIPGRRKILPLFHLDSLLGIGTGNIVWNNYQARYYYFPVQIPNIIDRHITQTFTDLEGIRADASDIESLIDRWARLLADHHSRIDVLVVWGADPRFDRINRQWYGSEPIFQRDDLRVFYRH
jgi:hypothetical protein